MKGPQYMSCQKKATGKFKNVVWSQTATNSFPAFLNSSVAIKLIIGHIIAIIIMEIASVITIGRVLVSVYLTSCTQVCLLNN